MSHSNDKIASLIGSRICHDLISPVGAVANGLELLELAGVPQSPELSLVADSANNASARIRLFRLAFGETQTEQRLPAGEVAEILTAVYAEGRTEIAWRVTGEPPRAEVKAALLAMLCAEDALSAGGRITVEENAGRWRITAEAARLSPDTHLWAILRGEPPGKVSPAAVQFVLLPQELTRQNRNCTVHLVENKAEISF